MDKIAVVILNWNQAHLTIECLRSVLKSRLDNKVSLEIVVVDNNSQDNSVKMFKNLKLELENSIKIRNCKLKIIVNNDNLGFTGGNNIGIRYALKDEADFVFILNNDTEIKNDCILELWKTFSKNENIGIVAPKIYYAPGFEFHKDRYKESDLGKVIWFAGGKIDWNNILGQHIGVDEVDKANLI